ncbi:hypothetical protein [Methanospirillum lacunae]|uniref:hypothetical protein n=1 Tax=Methanospirillum lacunae TaxID=668570 RepID=UPI001FEBCEF7|nr:hypothetical protein [Methanospirillum lacunae]
MIERENQVSRHRKNSRAYYLRNRTRILQKRREKMSQRLKNARYSSGVILLSG